jgi:hypothetical protein
MEPLFRRVRLTITIKGRLEPAGDPYAEHHAEPGIDHPAGRCTVDSRCCTRRVERRMRSKLARNGPRNGSAHRQLKFSIPRDRGPLFLGGAMRAVG